MKEKFRVLFNRNTDIAIFAVLGKKAYIRNGVGYGFISNEYLYDNIFLEIGFGRVGSGYGDWGGGATHASDSPLKIVIDKNYVIQKIETSSFYNSKESQRVEKQAEKFKKSLKVGSVLKIKDGDFKVHIDKLLSVLPIKSHIGHDVFHSPHMLEHFTDPKHKYDYKFADPKCLNKE